MNQRKLRGMLLVSVLLFVVFWGIIFSATNTGAEIYVTPTLYATNWNYMPYIRSLKRGPTATATLPPPTMTPWATNTNTPTSTTEVEHTPTATASITPSPTATYTARPPSLPAPTIYEIDNSDQDGNFTVSWTAVAGAEYLQVEAELQRYDLGYPFTRVPC